MNPYLKNTYAVAVICFVTMFGYVLIKDGPQETTKTTKVALHEMVTVVPQPDTANASNLKENVKPIINPSTTGSGATPVINNAETGGNGNNVALLKEVRGLVGDILSKTQGDAPTFSEENEKALNSSVDTASREKFIYDTAREIGGDNELSVDMARHMYLGAAISKKTGKVLALKIGKKMSENNRSYDDITVATAEKVVKQGESIARNTLANINNGIRVISREHKLSVAKKLSERAWVDGNDEDLISADKFQKDKLAKKLASVRRLARNAVGGVNGLRKRFPTAYEFGNNTSNPGIKQRGSVVKVLQ